MCWLANIYLAHAFFIRPYVQPQARKRKANRHLSAEEDPDGILELPRRKRGTAAAAAAAAEEAPAGDDVRCHFFDFLTKRHLIGGTAAFHFRVSHAKDITHITLFKWWFVCIFFLCFFFFYLMLMLPHQSSTLANCIYFVQPFAHGFSFLSI